MEISDVQVRDRVDPITYERISCSSAACALRLEPTVKVQTIIIVGAGISGLACALACSAAGARVVVFDGQYGSRSVPAHVDVRSNLLRDLSRLGIARDCVRRGFVYNGFSLANEEGDEVLRIPTPRLTGDQLPPALGISHANFLDVLETAARTSGVEIRHGSQVQRVESRTGWVLTDRGENMKGELVVLALDAESPLVASVRGTTIDTPMRQEWLHTLISRPRGIDRPLWMGGRLGRHLYVVPISMSQAGLAVRAGDFSIGGSQELAATLIGWGGYARQIAAAIDASRSLVRCNVSVAQVCPPWYRDAVLCTDASTHATAPLFDFSAALAVESGLVLGELVGLGLERQALLRHFMNRRVARVQRIHTLTDQATQWMSRPDPSTDLMAIGKQIHALVAEPA